MKDTLGDRMKAYEDAYRVYLPPRMPIVIRVDGRAFHTLLKGANKPFDHEVMFAMDRVLTELAEHAQGCVLGYTQSDEASIVLQNDRNNDTQQWFGGNLQKIITAAAALATKTFNRFGVTNKTFGSLNDKHVREATFDARAWIMPWEDVPNYFLWRQQDYKRNAISMAARAMFSHKDCVNKDTDMLLLMMEAKGVKFHEQYSNRERFGYFVTGQERLPEIGDTNYQELNEVINRERTATTS